MLEEITDKNLTYGELAKERDISFAQLVGLNNKVTLTLTLTLGSRPDGVIWSMQTKTVIWIELTSPWKENLTKKHFEKMDKYNKLAIGLREGKHHGVKWTVVPLFVEVGARGAINEQPWNWMCKRLGFSKCSKRRLTQAVQDAAEACSYYIFLCRFLRTCEPHSLVDTLERSEC